MAYTVNYTNPGKTPIIIEDQTANNSTSLTLIGKQYDQYGEIIAENFLKVLENFSYTSAPTNPTPGQLWHDTSSKILKVYDASGIWKPLSVVYTSTTSPTTNAAQATGDLWTNTVTGEIFVYSGSEWVELAAQTQVSGMKVTTRIDNATTPVTHYTIEAVNNTQTIFVISTEDGWTPASSERLTDNTVMNLSFPILYKGINFNSTGSYGIHNLSTTRIDVGRSTQGHLILENNQYDSSDGTIGAGVTLRTTQNPINGSIFSVRSQANTSRLWVGQSTTSVGGNDFVVGFTGEIGKEYDQSLYNIKLASDGSISAKTISGSWVATNNETVNGTISNKIVTPAGTRAAIDARFVERISTDSLSRATAAEATATPVNINDMVNDKLMTPLRTRQAINQYTPQLIDNEITGLFDDASLTNTGYQKFPNGLIIQWGKVTVGPAGNNETNVITTFPIAFVAPLFSLTLGSDISYNALRISNITQTRFTTTNYTERTTLSVYWTAIGKWK